MNSFFSPSVRPSRTQQVEVEIYEPFGAIAFELINAALLGSRGVKKVRYSAKGVEISYDPAILTQKTIREAFHRAGFRIAGIGRWIEIMEEEEEEDAAA